MPDLDWQSVAFGMCVGIVIGPILALAALAIIDRVGEVVERRMGQ